MGVRRARGVLVDLPETQTPSRGQLAHGARENPGAWLDCAVGDAAVSEEEATRSSTSRAVTPEPLGRNAVAPQMVDDVRLTGRVYLVRQAKRHVEPGRRPSVASSGSADARQESSRSRRSR